MQLARQITNYMNAFRLAFKTYGIKELDEMMRNVAGEGARVSTADAASQFETCMLERGFVVFPSIADNNEGYVRIYRAASLIGNLLSAFRYPGPNGDNELAHLLITLQQKKRHDDLDNDQDG